MVAGTGATDGAVVALTEGALVALTDGASVLFCKTPQIPVQAPGPR